MRRQLIVIATILLFGCDSREDKACDEAVKAQLKSPSSYKRVKKEGRRIEYDAVNSFNAPIRGRGKCFFFEADGSALFSPEVTADPYQP